MTKLGKKYERVVAEIVQQFDPEAQVEVGTWINGPDGAREIDILISFKDGTKTKTFIIECKDYKRKRRIGIEVIDAFASKLGDLNAAGAVCSNADFTAPARKKAQRLSIGLIGVFSSDKEGSNYEIVENFEWRQIKAESWKITCQFSSKNPPPFSEFRKLFTPNGNSLIDLGADLLNVGLVKFPVVSGNVHFKCNLSEPLLITGSDCFLLNGIEASVKMHGVWLNKLCHITMEQGVYNWATRRSLDPSGSPSVAYHGIEVDKPELWTPRPKLFTEPMERERVDGQNIGMRMSFIMLEGFSSPKVSELAPESVELIGNIEDHWRSIPKKSYSEQIRKSQLQRTVST